MAAINDQSTGTSVKVDSTSNGMRSRLYNADGTPMQVLSTEDYDSASNEGIIVAGYNDGRIRHARMDRTGGQSIALNQLLFSDQFEGATLNANKWTSTATTMTASQTAAIGMTFNNGNSVANTVGILLKTIKTFYKSLRSINHVKFRARIEHYTGAVIEVGFGDATTMNGAHTNGAYLQVTAAGAVQLVWTFNGSDTTSTAIVGLNASNYYTYDIILDDDSATLFVQDTSTGLILAERTITLPLAAAKQFASTRLNAFARQYHSAAPATAPHLFLTLFDVVTMDNNQNLDIAAIAATQGLGAAFNPLTGVGAINWTNSAAPSSATLSNTAAGYTTLGGLFQFAAVAGAATDYCLFGFTVPAPTSFHCTGVDIESWNTGAAVATTPTLLVWGMGINQSAVSLATASIGRIGLGSQSFAVAAAIGANAQRISVQFRDPKVTDSGRFMTVILRMPVGTATASQVVQGIVNIHGYFV